MDTTATQQQAPRQRELMFCHQCENEWYRDEHGIICPDCQSDFTEIIEAGHDPREDEEMPELEPQHPGHEHGWYAPDPDEGDIDDLHWEENGPGGPPGGRLTGTLTRNVRIGAGGQQGGHSGGGGGGLLGMLGPILQGALGGVINPQQQPQHGQGQERGDTPGGAGEGGQHAPESPRGGNGRTFTRHAHGPGFSYTITTHTGGNLLPRDANNPQPFQAQPDNIEQLMAQMFANIGARPYGHGPGAGGPFVGMPGGGPHGGGGMGGPPMMFGDVFQLLGMAHSGTHGDAVYSQEALDRVITQLMEQHQTGNAPPPASAEAIQNLPEKQIGENDLDEKGEANCSICMDTAEIGSTVRELPCHHWFHFDCIKHWLAEHDTCPHCRQGIMPKDENARSDRPRQSSQAPRHDMHSPDYQRTSNIPGSYPFPQQHSSGGEGSGNGRGNGSQENPFRVSESPERNRNGGAAGGLFGRMRQAFSPGGSNNYPSNTDSEGPGGRGNGANSGN